MKTMCYERYDYMKVIKHYVVVFLLMFLLIPKSDAQQTSEKQKTRNEIPPLKERLFYGGSLGLQFGTFTDIELSPIIGLWVLPRVGIAVGPTFRYNKNPFYRTLIYGGRTYIQYIFLQDLDNIVPLGLHVGLFLHLEDEALSLESSVFRNPASSGRFLMNTVLAGGGIRQPLGQRSSLNIMFLWALNNSDYGVYSNPDIRISVTF